MAGPYCSNLRYHSGLRAHAAPDGRLSVRIPSLPHTPLPRSASMRPSTRTLLFLAALAAASAAPARAQVHATPASASAPSQEIDPCTGKPRRDPAGGTSANPSQSGANASQPGGASGTSAPPSGASASSTASGADASQPASTSSTASGANASQPGSTSSTASGVNASQPGSASSGTNTVGSSTHPANASSNASGADASQPGSASSTASGANASQPGSTSSTASGANASQPGSASNPASGANASPSGATPTGTQASGTNSSASPSSTTGGEPDGQWSHAGASDTTAARRNRAALRLGTGMPNQVRLGPAASVSVPTAFGVDAGELFFGVGYQGRTRYTDQDDAAAVAGLGIGKRSLVALEVALTTYSTLRGAPLETGGLSFKVHRALPGNTSVAVGWENAVLWGGSDDAGSLYGVATRVFTLREDPSAPFSMAVFTLGVGNGRFRFEEDDAKDRKTVNLFAAAGLRVAEQVSLVGDWTGQDLNVAASFTPFPRVPLVLTTGLADLTGSAGDGIRFILSLGYGTSIRLPR
jgi:hypothetical protein